MTNWIGMRQWLAYFTVHALSAVVLLITVTILEETSLWKREMGEDPYFENDGDGRVRVLLVIFLAPLLLLIGLTFLSFVCSQEQRPGFKRWYGVRPKNTRRQGNSRFPRLLPTKKQGGCRGE